MALENKLGITDSAELAREEEMRSKKRRYGFLRKESWIHWMLEALQH